jgi:hypothetical protein
MMIDGLFYDVNLTSWAERDPESYQKAFAMDENPSQRGRECCTEFGIPSI